MVHESIKLMRENSGKTLLSVLGSFCLYVIHIEGHMYLPRKFRYKRDYPGFSHLESTLDLCGVKILDLVYSAKFKVNYVSECQNIKVKADKLPRVTKRH